MIEDRVAVGVAVAVAVVVVVGVNGRWPEPDRHDR
jgi:hypothetical protein